MEQSKVHNLNSEEEENNLSQDDKMVMMDNEEKVTIRNPKRMKSSVSVNEVIILEGVVGSDQEGKEERASNNESPISVVVVDKTPNESAPATSTVTQINTEKDNDNDDQEPLIILDWDRDNLNRFVDDDRCFLSVTFSKFIEEIWLARQKGKEERASNNESPITVVDKTPSESAPATSTVTQINTEKDNDNDDQDEQRLKTATFGKLVAELYAERQKMKQDNN